MFHNINYPKFRYFVKIISIIRNANLKFYNFFGIYIINIDTFFSARYIKWQL